MPLSMVNGLASCKYYLTDWLNMPLSMVNWLASCKYYWTDWLNMPLSMVNGLTSFKYYLTDRLNTPLSLSMINGLASCKYYLTDWLTMPLPFSMVNAAKRWMSTCPVDRNSLNRRNAADKETSAIMVLDTGTRQSKVLTSCPSLTDRWAVASQRLRIETPP